MAFFHPKGKQVSDHTGYKEPAWQVLFNTRHSWWTQRCAYLYHAGHENNTRPDITTYIAGRMYEGSTSNTCGGTNIGGYCHPNCGTH